MKITVTAISVHDDETVVTETKTWELSEFNAHAALIRMIAQKHPDARAWLDQHAAQLMDAPSSKTTLAIETEANEFEMLWAANGRFAWEDPDTAAALTGLGYSQ